MTDFVNWPEFNAEVNDRMIEVQGLAGVDALLRFDYCPDQSWGFAVEPRHPFPNGSHEIYGVGISPLHAADDAINKIVAALL